MRVLLVEDETALADVIARSLRARGHSVTLAPTAGAALLSLAAEWPDVLLLDVNLPDMTGWEILRRLGESDGRHLPVVVISAAPISPKRIEEFKPASCLMKPFPIDALLRILSELNPPSEPADPTGEPP
jgi:two-component system OmpR family response regulator